MRSSSEGKKWKPGGRLVAPPMLALAVQLQFAGKDDDDEEGEMRRGEYEGVVHGGHS
jgi:hypothetical protein